MTTSEPVLLTEGDAKKIVRERAANMCELRIPGVCRGRYESYQHRKRRGHCTRAELWDPANGLGVCGDGTVGCHGWITGHPARSEERGWSLRETWIIAERDAWMYSFNYGGAGWYLLDSNGGLGRVWEKPAPMELAA